MSYLLLLLINCTIIGSHTHFHTIWEQLYTYQSKLHLALPHAITTSVTNTITTSVTSTIIPKLYSNACTISSRAKVIWASFPGNIQQMVLDVHHLGYNWRNIRISGTSWTCRVGGCRTQANTGHSCLYIHLVRCQPGNLLQGGGGGGGGKLDAINIKW